MRRGAAGARGFTLLELLLAMTILAVLSALLFGGLRFGVRVWEGGSHSLQTLEETHAVQSALRRMIGGARLAQVTTLSDEVPPVFDGSPTSVVFVGLAPAPVLMGSLYWLRIAEIDEEGDGPHLLLSWAYFDADSAAVDPFEMGAHKILLRRIEEIQIDYFGPVGEEAALQWVPKWRSADQLPALVRIQVVFPAGDARVWPELVIVSKYRSAIR